MSVVASARAGCRGQTTIGSIPIPKTSAMRTDNAPTISRHDYRPYPYELHEVQLCFDLEAERTRVKSRLMFEGSTNAPLILNGEELELESISIDGQPLS